MSDATKPKTVMGPSPDLNSCLTILKNTHPALLGTSNASSLSHAQLQANHPLATTGVATRKAEWIVSMVGFAFHLARDLELLSAFLRSNVKESPNNNLPISEMPAIRELMTDRTLFQNFLSMLIPIKRDDGSKLQAAKGPSLKGPSLKGQPMKGQPMKRQPMKGLPGQPMKGLPGQPMKGLPMKGQPMKGHLMKGLPGQPMKGLPIKGQTLKSQQMKGLPLKSQPPKGQALKGMRPPPPAESNNSSAGMPQSFQQKQGRKRSPSASESDQVTRKKLLLSPSLPTVAINRKSVQSKAGQGNILEPSVSPAYAAVIFYSVMQHVDQWPMAFMRAFAEDSFGPRAWVDDDRCKRVTSNLAISLKPRVDTTDRSCNAEQVEAYFASLTKESPNKKTLSPSSNKPLPKNRPGDLPSLPSAKEPSAKEKRKQAKRAQSSGESSSSGEEEVIESEVSNLKPDADVISVISTASSSQSHRPSLALSSPLHLLFSFSSLDKPPVRPRYLGPNLPAAHAVVSTALAARLQSKSKQNSKLLQVLPHFVAIPAVRLLVSRNLEKWLQSPALAGLARNLFSKVVRGVKNVDPPLKQDSEAINNILNMNLKANQFSAHVDNVTIVAKTIPTTAIAQQIFTHCLRITESNRTTDMQQPSNDHLRMLYSVYATLDPTLASTSLASSVLSLTSLPDVSVSQQEHEAQFQSTRRLLRLVVDTLGHLYDGYLFAKTIIRAKAGTDETAPSIQIIARLLFECMVLVSRTYLDGSGVQFDSRNSSNSILADSLDAEQLDKFRTIMMKMRKMVLGWCVSDLCRVYHPQIIQEEQTLEGQDNTSGAVAVAPPIPDYSSVLDGKPFGDSRSKRSKFRELMSLIRCLLFLSPPSSKEMKKFLNPLDSSNELGDYEYQRIYFCCHYGVDIDDEMLQIILTAYENITSNTALSIIENLVLGCGSTATANITVSNSAIIWEMYKLAKYAPALRERLKKTAIEESAPDETESESHLVGSKRKADADEEGNAKLDLTTLPCLAYPSLWWRVTSVALVMSSISPKDVGSSMWKEHPTLRSLIKMTTSQKYRFPTADCSESEKERVKLTEEKLKQEESRVAELLFMPPQEKKPKKPKIESSVASAPVSHRGRLRSSTRQREKQEKRIALEREREAAALHAEAIKFKKRLRAAQKSIMLWDPKQEERKPPKGSIDLLLAVNERFQLAEKLRLCTNPDFLLQTIGEGRSAIERAYDWLIPIISSHSKIIDRLQPSASCFLLLRAYGAEGDQNRELLDLSAPLLFHVSNCLTGEYGEHHALLAVELLLQDVADESSDRRRCARNVLQEAVGNAVDVDFPKFQFDLGLCGWLFQLIHVKNSKALVPVVIKYVSHALAYERGKVLSIYVLALFEYKKFAKKNGIEDNFDFVSSLCELISIRPHVCSDAMDRFPDLRTLAVDTVKTAFDDAIVSKEVKSPTIPSPALVIVTLPSEKNESREGPVHLDVVIPSNLMQAAIILISNWHMGEGSGFMAITNGNDAEPIHSSIMSLLKYLIVPFTFNDSNEASAKSTSGAANARYMDGGARAVSVVEWVLLAKARADFVAKHAALSAPDIFLPRLLLCCGMPRSSFVTMLKRLGKMGDSSPDRSKTFGELISPTAVAEWGPPRIGGRRVIKRKIHGRISAYLRINSKNLNVDEMNEMSTAAKSSFVSWLSSECSLAETGKKSLSKHDSEKRHVKSCMSQPLLQVGYIDLTEKDGIDISKDIWPVIAENESRNPLSSTETISEEFVKSCCTMNNYSLLEESLTSIEARNIFNEGNNDSSTAIVLLSLLTSLYENRSFVRIFLKWVPQLTQHQGDHNLWQLLFIDGMKTSLDQRHFEVMMSLVCDCAITWSNEHIASCQSWILSQQSKCSLSKSIFSLKLSLRFLVISSEQRSVHCFDYDNDDAHCLQFAYVQTQERAVSVIKLSLDLIALENKTAGPVAGQPFQGRDLLPDWLLLILMVARCGKSNVNLTIDHILNCISSDSKAAPILQAVLLRIYAMSPLKTSLNEPRLRNSLLQASIDYSFSWLEWRCPFDDRVSEMLSNLTSSPHQSTLQSIIDLAKQHPLILVRHLRLLSEKLFEDGSGIDNEQRGLDKRGRIKGKVNEGEAIAKIGDKTFKVVIVQWGFSFSESVWTSAIDVISSLPTEVAFTCGLKSGLKDVFELYLKLFVTHMVTLGAEGNILRVRAKFTKLLQSFKKSKEETFQDWMNFTVNGWGTVQSLIFRSGLDDASDRSSSAAT